MTVKPSRYDEILQIIYETYEDLGITEFPVNPFEIAKKLNIKLIPYSNIKDDKLFALFNVSDKGFKLFNCNKQQFEIYYNDIKSIEIINFTIMHEIGHITLGHKGENEKAEETEANYFSKNSLAPLALIIVLNINDSFDISDFFGVSMPCANFILDNFYRATSFPSIVKKYQESSIVKLFPNIKLQYRKFMENKIA